MADGHSAPAASGLGIVPQRGLSHVAGKQDVPLLDLTIPDLLTRCVRVHPDAEAVVFPAQSIRWTWSELAQQVDALAGGLSSIGIEKGDRVGIWAPNRVEWLLTQFATARIGAILVNINPAYRVFELEFALRKTGCKALILAEAFKTSDYIAMLRELVPELATSSPLVWTIFHQVHRAADRNGATELALDFAFEMFFCKVQRNLTCKLTIRQLRQTARFALDAHKTFDIAIPRLDIVVADRPRDTMSVAFIGFKVEVAPTIGLAAPNNRLAADRPGPRPHEGFVRIIDERKPRVIIPIVRRPRGCGPLLEVFVLRAGSPPAAIRHFIGGRAFVCIIHTMFDHPTAIEHKGL